MAAVVQPASPSLCRRRQASFGSRVCGHFNGILPPGSHAYPAVILRHLRVDSCMSLNQTPSAPPSLTTQSAIPKSVPPLLQAGTMLICD